MEKTDITLENPIILNGLKIIPVVSLFLSSSYPGNAIAMFGVKKPIAFLVISSSEKRLYDISGEEISMEYLTESFPSIKEILEKL